MNSKTVRCSLCERSYLLIASKDTQKCRQATLIQEASYLFIGVAHFFSDDQAEQVQESLRHAFFVTHNNGSCDHEVPVRGE